MKNILPDNLGGCRSPDDRPGLSERRDWRKSMTQPPELTTGRPITDIDLSEITRSILERNNVVRIGDLLKQVNEKTLREIPGIGEGREREIHLALQRSGADVEDD